MGTEEPGLGPGDPTPLQRVVCGSGPGGSRPHNCRRVRHCGREQPRLGRTAAVESNSSICFKRLLLTPVSSCCSQQMQGVVGAALNRWHELRVRCTASASHSSAEAASSVLSTSPESWIPRVGRANSSTRQADLGGTGLGSPDHEKTEVSQPPHPTPSCTTGAKFSSARSGSADRTHAYCSHFWFSYSTVVRAR